MNPYDENEDQEIEELASRFRQAVEHGESVYFDSTDLQDIISVFLENGELELCKTALKQAITNFPQEPYFHLLYAKYYALQFRFTDAERELDFVEQNFDPIPELYLEKVLLARASNKHIDTENLLLKSLKMDEAIPETHLLLTIEYVHQKRIADAVQHAKRAIQLDSTIAEDLKVLILDFTFASSKEDNPVINFFKTMTEEMPLCSQMWGGLGLAYTNINQFEKAIDAFQFQTSVDSDDPFAYVNLGEAYFASADYASAAENFLTANEKCDHFSFNIQIGRCYTMLKLYNDALQYFIKSNDNDPFYQMKYTEIVKVFRILDQLDDARTYLRMHIQDCPNDFNALEELLNLLDAEKDHDEMNVLFHKIEAICNSELEFLDFVTTFCYNNDCPDLGLSFCKQHLDSESVTDSIGYFMAALYLKKGLIQQGCDHLENALLICKNRFIPNFIRIDYKLSEIPQVAKLLDRYGCNSDPNIATEDLLF